MKTIDAAYEQINIRSAFDTGFEKLVGVQMSQIQTGGIADKAGLKEGDILYVFNDEEINSSMELKAEVTLAPSDETSSLRVWRDGEDIDLELTPDYNYSDTEFVYKSIKEAHQSCQLDLKCIKNHLDNVAKSQKNRYLQQLLESVVAKYDREMDGYNQHVKQCSGDEYLAARDAMTDCHVQVYDNKVKGKSSKIGDDAFNQCLHKKLSALADNDYAKAGLAILGPEASPSEGDVVKKDVSEAQDASESEEGGQDKEHKACMMYWLD